MATQKKNYKKLETEAGDHAKAGRERVRGRREGNGINILKFIDGDANKMMDLSGNKQCVGSIEAM